MSIRKGGSLKSHLFSYQQIKDSKADFNTRQTNF